MATPSRMQALMCDNLKGTIGLSLRAAERELEHETAGAAIFDLTYADTNRFPAPEWALDTFAAAASGGGMTYTPYRGDSVVVSDVAENVSSVLGLRYVDEANVMLAPGTQGALFVALASIIEPGDTVVLPEPDYLSTERTLRYLGAEVIRVPIVFPTEGRPYIDQDILANAMRGARMFVFSHPNNPTGAIFSEECLRGIAELANAHDVTVLADELYCRLVYDDEVYHHIAMLDGMSERTITLLGPSKTESLSGYRLGVAVAPAAAIDLMEDLQSVTALRAPAYAQHLLRHWLKDDQEFVAKRVKEYENLRDMTATRLSASSVLRPMHSWGTAYIYPDLVNGMSAREASLLLKREAGLVVNPGYQFGQSGERSLRLCFAQDEARWSEGLDTMISVLSR